MPRIIILLLTALLFLVALSPAARAEFSDGDLYLLSPTLPGEQGSWVTGIVKLDPLTGASILFHESDNIIYPQFVFDSQREKLLYVKFDRKLMAVDSSGSASVLFNLATVPSGMAFGNGLVYMRFGNEYHYLDQAGNLLPVLDQAGSLAFRDGGSAENLLLQYDAGTNAIIAFLDNEGVCGGFGTVCALKIPLTGDGTQVAGPVDVATVDVSDGAEQIVGVGSRNTGDILFVVDTNTNLEEDRMQLLNPVTMSISTYANSGPYTGAAVISAGTYSNVRNQAVILDSFNDVIRVYNPGSTGAGGVISGSGDGYGVSGSGSNEQARLIEISHPSVAAAVPEALLGNVRFLAPHPNPFNPSTALRFELGRTQGVLLQVFDVRGALVTTLVEGTRGEGWHQVAWDGRYASGRLAASGVYFARLQTAGSAQVQRMVLLE
jgi:hypothetical protein